jgi:hypothetical protein
MPVEWGAASATERTLAGWNTAETLPMDGERPRYEFRVWADSLTEVRERIGVLGRPEGSHRSAETYFVSRRTADANPKVRGDVLDVKLLAGSFAGLEQWRVEMKVEFPVPSVALGDLFDHLDVVLPRLDRERYSLGELRRELIEPHPDLASVGVAKTRRFSTVAGCRAEHTEAVAAGRRMETVAVEAVEPDALEEACRLLGLCEQENVSYPRMLRRLLGWEARTSGGARR